MYIGKRRLPIEQIFEGGVSYARNPKIQNMLRMVGYGENLGSGFPLILDAWKQAGWDTPVLNNKLELDMVELVLPIPVSMRVPKGVSKGVSKETLEELSDAAIRVYGLIKENPKINRNDLAKQTGVSLKNIQKHINKLKQIGAIRRVGSPKYGYWEIVE